VANVLVTGGAGYVGSHACKALARAGFVPVAYDSLVQGHRRAVRWGPLEEGDIADGLRLRSVFAQYQPIAVIHFAAHAYVGESVADPGKYYRNNVAGSLALLEAMRDAGIDKLVFSSTCATYGMPEQPLIREEHPQRPISPYGASKLMIERMLADFDVAHGLRYMALRYFNAAGADPDGDIGEQHEPETHLIPLAIEAALGRREDFAVFGTDYDTPDGTCIRDFIHVEDLADAHVLAVKALLGGCASTAYNLGTGRGHSVQDVLDSVARTAGRVFRIRRAARRPGDPPRLVADPSKVRRSLGWQARYTDLDEIVQTACKWHERGGR